MKKRSVCLVFLLLVLSAVFFAACTEEGPSKQTGVQTTAPTVITTTKSTTASATAEKTTAATTTAATTVTTVDPWTPMA